MPFFYHADSSARRFLGIGGWRVLNAHGKALHYQPDPEFSLLQTPANRLTDGTSGPAWLVVEGYPRLDQNPASEPGDLTLLGRDILEGTSALARWRGGFVALLVIPELDRTICVRDSLGARTLYYREVQQSVSISGSAHLLASLQKSISEDTGFLSALFALRAERPPGRTAFDGIGQLLPGQRLCLDNARCRLKRNPIGLPSIHEGSPYDLPEMFRSRFRSAVERVLPEEGPAAVMLSGGLDSAPVACVAASLMKSRGRSLHAISWRLPDFPQCDEADWIRTVARHAEIELHEFNGGDYPAFSILDTAASNPDFPAYNAFRPLFNGCYHIARDLGIPVLLNAHAGDLIYPGRETELSDLFRRREARRLIISIVREIARSPTQLHRNRALRGLASYLIGRSSSKPRAPKWLTAEGRSDLESLDFSEWLPEAEKHGVPAYCRRLLALGISGGPQYEVRMSKEFGVARRDPFCDLDLLLFMLSIPPWMQLNESQDKWLMRQAMRGILPESVRTKGKTGLLYSFFRSGFRQQLPRIRERLMDSPDWSRWVDKNFVETALSPESSDRQMMVVNACLGYVLWRERIQESPFGTSWKVN